MTVDQQEGVGKLIATVRFITVTLDQQEHVKFIGRVKFIAVTLDQQGVSLSS